MENEWTEREGIPVFFAKVVAEFEDKKERVRVEVNHDGLPVELLRFERNAMKEGHDGSDTLA
jgi:hypothetical protein